MSWGAGFRAGSDAKLEGGTVVSCLMEEIRRATRDVTKPELTSSGERRIHQPGKSSTIKNSSHSDSHIVIVRCLPNHQNWWLFQGSDPFIFRKSPHLGELWTSEPKKPRSKPFRNADILHTVCRNPKEVETRSWKPWNEVFFSESHTSWQVVWRPLLLATVLYTLVVFFAFLVPKRMYAGKVVDASPMKCTERLATASRRSV